MNAPKTSEVSLSDADDDLLILRENAAELFHRDGPGSFRDDREVDYFTFTGTDISGYVDDIWLHGVSFSRQLERTAELDAELESLSGKSDFDGVTIEASDSPRDITNRTLCIYGEPMDSRVAQLTEYIPFETPVLTVEDFRTKIDAYLDDGDAFEEVFHAVMEEMA